ncbi:Crossover junction endonuclease mus81, variant 2 [Batrachochytrium dendrobatidis]
MNTAIGPTRKAKSTVTAEPVNSLFVQWLTEWYEKAKTDAHVSSAAARLPWIYKKALDNMKQYPERLQSGTAAIKVKSIGPKTAERLQKKLQSHFQENPEARIEWEQAICSDSAKQLNLESKSLSNVDRSGHGPLTMTCNEQSDSIGDLNLQTSKTSRSIKSHSRSSNSTAESTNMYVPRYRSGAYAILLALYKHAPLSSVMSKQEIISSGQQYTEASFSISNSTSGQPHTAWNSMATLIKKEFVIKTGVPHRFSLTEEGISMAKLLTRLQSSSPLNSQQVQLQSSQSSTVYIELSGSEISHSDTGISDCNEPLTFEDDCFQVELDSLGDIPFLSSNTAQVGNSAANLSRQTLHKTVFSYIDCDGNMVSSRNEAGVAICEQTSTVRYRVQFDLHQVTSEFLQHVKIEECMIDLDRQVRGLLHDSFAPDYSTEIPASRNQQSMLDDRLESATHTPITSYPLVTSNSSKIPATDGFVLPKTSKIQLIHFPAGSFEIHLVLDSREVVKKSNRQLFQTELAQLGVPILTRALALGDFIWVARRRIANAATSKEFEDHEIVLDSIIERKLMSDLVASIKDNRYKEQKFRLSNCGLSNITYLIEDGSGSDAEGFGMGRIRAAMTQIQVLDHFFLKRSSSALDTVAYLHCMTKFITTMNKNKDLYALRAVDVSKDTVLQMRRTVAADLKVSLDTILLSYEAYHGINTKTGAFTCGDLWIRQLMCIPGVSAEKAAVLAARFPTPLSMVKSLASIPDKKAKIAMLRSLGEGRKGVGAALALTIIEFFEADMYSK